MPRHKQQISNVGGRPDSQDLMKILSAESYGDEAAVTIARSLTELAQPRHDPSRYMLGISGGFEVVKETRPSTPQTKVQNVEEKGKRTRKTRRSRVANPSEDEERGGGRKKRQKISEDEYGEDDDASKKARGRPRLDTKDETAADRRRTQIRMAQRAYRHRKETTIASLETQVEKLQNATEEMNNVFINLYDFAASKGLLQREPEFAQHLQSTTRQVLALAKRTSIEEFSHDDDSNHRDNNKLTKHGTSADSDLVRQKVQPLSPPEQGNLSQSKPALENHAPSNEDACALLHYYNSQTSVSNQQPPESQTPSQSSLDGENLDFDMSNVDLHQLRSEIPDMNAYPFDFRIGNDRNLINTPISFANLETSFSRRLHRVSNERGFRLLTNPNAPPKLINRAFGCSLLFRTKEQLLESLKATLERTTTTKVPLSNWRAPFVHLGGSGTYYPVADDDLSSNMMPKIRTGRSMGPLTPVAMSVRDTHMTDDFTMAMEGFDGKYFDSNDVEGYLRGKGIDIPPGTEYVTVNLDMVSLENVPFSPAPVSFDTENGNSATISPRTPLSPSMMNSSNDDQISQSQNFELMDEIQVQESFTTRSQYVDPSTATYQDASWNWINMPPSRINNYNKSIGKHSPSLNAFDLSGSIFNTSSSQQTPNNSTGWDSSASESPRLVTICVSSLVHYISNRGVCLGRAPGFRPQDVDIALRRTIAESF